MATTVTFSDDNDEIENIEDVSGIRFEGEPEGELLADGSRDYSDAQKETLILMERQRRRYDCSDIIPEVSRVVQKPEKERHHILHLYKTLMERARFKGITQKVKNLSDFDRSAAIIPHGQTSKKLFKTIFDRRPYDLYARVSAEQDVLSHEKEVEMEEIARKMGILYESKKTKNTKAEIAATYLPDPYGRDNVRSLKPPKITTDVHSIGYKPIQSAPPGFAEDPVPLSNSYGHEAFYSYDGSWRVGKMDGSGRYLFEDDYDYVGEFHKNKFHGEGLATYKEGSSYEGDWHSGMYSGIGTQSLRNNLATYEGAFREGRRSGNGTIRYECGLVYEGDFVDGKPHGRGKMTSSLTGYYYEGGWKRGGIAGSGTLYTPPPELKRIVRFWPGGHRPQQLYDVIKWYLHDLEMTEYKDLLANSKMFGVKRSLKLKQYVSAVRKSIHDERYERKKEQKAEELRKFKEYKQKLHEAKMAALLGADNHDDD